MVGDSLQTETLHNSRSLGNALQDSGTRLQSLSKRIASLQHTIAPMKTLPSRIAARIDHALGPAISVLQAFDAIHGLHTDLLHLHPHHDLEVYPSRITCLQQALFSLSNTCPVATQRLQEMVDFLHHNHIEEDRMEKLHSNLSSFRVLQIGMDRATLHGGPLHLALQKLELEFKRIVSKACQPILLTLTSNAGKSFPSLVLEDVEMLHMIIEKLGAHSRIQNCKDIYTQVRSSIVKSSIQPLHLDYLELLSVELSTKPDWKLFEQHIGPWMLHIQVFIQLVLEPEYHLCCQIFQNLDLNERTECFAKLANHSGLILLLQ